MTIDNMMRCYSDAQVTRTPLKLWLKPCKAEDPEQRWFFTQYEVHCHAFHGYHLLDCIIQVDMVGNTVLPFFKQPVKNILLVMVSQEEGLIETYCS